jgi:hypothetical protein
VINIQRPQSSARLARYCGRHGTHSNSNTNRNATTASLMSPPRERLNMTVFVT